MHLHVFAPNHLPNLPKIKPAPLTVHYELWVSELESDKDKQFLLDGLKNGFSIVTPEEQLTHVHCRNYRSATDPGAKQLSEIQIMEEIDRGRYVICNFIPPIVSSLGAIPKKSGGVRLIHDCSRPHGLSVNSYSNKCSFKYDTVDRAVELLPQGGFMAKVDLSLAYRSVPIHPSCYAYTGLYWQFIGDSAPTYFIDTRLPFGASESPEKFQRLTSAVTRMMARRGYTVIAYLDDFLVIEADFKRCNTAYKELLCLLQSLGFTINWDKVVAPVQIITFLGVQINSVAMQLSLPPEKLQELRSILTTWQYKKKATKKDLQQLIGKLNWAARVVRGGRTFLRRLIDLMCTLKFKHYHVRLNASARADITWWANFISLFNGTARFLSSNSVPAAYLTSDACNSGGAAVYNQDWFYTNWDIDHPDFSNAHINIKELLAVLLAAKRWAWAWQNMHIVLYTDSTCAMFMINNGTSRNSIAMQLLRVLFWLSAIFNFKLTARHIQGKNNIASDYISRLDANLDWPARLASYHLDTHVFSQHMSHGCMLYLQDIARLSGAS